MTPLGATWAHVPGSARLCARRVRRQAWMTSAALAPTVSASTSAALHSGWGFAPGSAQSLPRPPQPRRGSNSRALGTTSPPRLGSPDNREEKAQGGGEVRYRMLRLVGPREQVHPGRGVRKLNQIVPLAKTPVRAQRHPSMRRLRLFEEAFTSSTFLSRYSAMLETKRFMSRFREVSEDGSKCPGDLLASPMEACEPCDSTQ